MLQQYCAYYLKCNAFKRALGIVLAVAVISNNLHFLPSQNDMLLWFAALAQTSLTDAMTQLETAERSFNKEAMQAKLEQEVPVLQSNPEQAAAYAAIKDAIDNEAATNVSLPKQHT